ncbi:TonB-linked outer membrane protein, SusC/RagA family [Chryseolinea serpens]|uniref:TonB-linked outer membrane protein, SusC/RagA family n=1 Tax=Chryseolinea serpens TaxID=947013 RepID=A0A1M5KIY3_9BACT|nr:TonB-dependent receptor [Chryseolinea serpens]SHG52721.1 TonB-linked outer membrane protein, SusC/RagA family [Chryseolinea serpens]
MKKYIHLFLFSLATIAAASAQTIVTGTVKGQSQEALPGVNVVIKNTTSGAITDPNGVFNIQIPAGLNDPTLIFSLIGYISQEISVGGQKNISVILAEDSKLLTEVVVTGYTAQEKQKITGAVNTVSAETLNKVPVASIDQALQGRAPGVVVSQNTGAPGEGVSIRIRGVGSINSGNSPLYIVDGVPTLDITSVSMQDVDNISVLKDASATAVYGARAANGVVIVTTKSGTTSAPKIQFNSQVGVQRPSRLIKMANTAQYAEIYNEAANADNATKTNPLFFRKLITDDMLATLPDVNYVDEIMRQDAILQTHSISVSGGDSKTRYFVSGNYFGQQGILKSSDYTRVTGRVNVDSQIKKWLKAGVNLNLSKATTDLVGSSGDGAGGNGGSVVRYAFFRTPAIPVYDAQGNFEDLPQRYDLFGDGYNPVGMLAYNNNKLLSNRLFGKFFVAIEPLEGLKLTSNVGIDFTSQNQRRFDRTWGTNNRINNINRLDVTDGRFQTVTFSNFLSYTKSFDHHHFTFLLGTESIKADNYSLNTSQKNFPDQESNLVYLGKGLGLVETAESKTGNALLSFFGKVDYDYSDKYLASVTLRRDGSSRFGPDNRWGNFYAGSVGWRLDKESFLVDNELIDLLKLRAGYGSIGNQEIGNYAFTDQINTGYNYPFGAAKGVGYAVSDLGNSRVHWENSNQLNVGADIAILNGKFTASLDYFHKITTDLLVRRPLPSSSGTASAPWVNDGKVLNRGVELAVSYSNTAGDFRYTISGNAATLHNEVLEVSAPFRGGAYGSDYLTLTEKGHPIGSFYLYETEGIFQDATDVFTHALPVSGVKPGDVKYKDQNQDGVIDADHDRKHLGSAIPKVTGGLTINLGYKNWDLSVFFQGAYGQKIFSVLNRDIEGFYRPFNVTERYYQNRWTGPGTSNEFPRASWDASGNNNIVYSQRFLESGSYTRLKNLQIGYTLPASLLKNYGFTFVRIYFSGTNLLTFTKYPGLDPEMTVSNNALADGDRASGLDWGTYPSAKSFNLGLSITF